MMGHGGDGHVMVLDVLALFQPFSSEYYDNKTAMNRFVFLGCVFVQMAAFMSCTR